MSLGTRGLAGLTAGLYGLLGGLLFALPGALAPAFAWKVSPFVTMTIGGWCLGNAWLAALVAWRGRWRLVYSTLLYLGLFGLLEAGVLVAFRAKLAPGHPVAWLYVAALASNVMLAAVAALEWLMRRPARVQFGARPGCADRAFVAAFFIFVAFLAGYSLLAPIGAPGTNGGIFPEVMSAFTLRSFAAFYLALALGAIPLALENSVSPGLHHGWASLGLIVIITLAALVNIRLFDFAARPGGLAYIGAYVIVGIPVASVLLLRGTGTRDKVP